MTKYRGLLDLADELLLLIVDYLAADPDTSLTVDKRAYLSQESFRSPSPPPRDQRKDVDNFRKTCRKLLAIGARQQYGRITTRFSKSGLKRLDGISDFPELAEHVKKFSYMVPCFYEGTFGAGFHMKASGATNFVLRPAEYAGIGSNGPTDCG